MNTQNKDPRLWEAAKKRVGFRQHLYIYIMVNVFLWLLWYFNGVDHTDHARPWPFWTTAGWGIGVLAHFYGAYFDRTESQIEKEYAKLVEQKNK
jgi:hypothetical protein